MAITERTQGEIDAIVGEWEKVVAAEAAAKEKVAALEADAVAKAGELEAAKAELATAQAAVEAAKEEGGLEVIAAIKSRLGIL